MLWVVVCLCWLLHCAYLQQLNVWLLCVILSKTFSMTSKYKYVIISTFYYFLCKNMWSEIRIYRSLNFQKHCRLFLLCLSVCNAKPSGKALFFYVGKKLVLILCSGGEVWHSEILNHHGHQLERTGKEKLRQQWKMAAGISWLFKGGLLSCVAIVTQDLCFL